MSLLKFIFVGFNMIIVRKRYEIVMKCINWTKQGHPPKPWFAFVLLHKLVARDYLDRRNLWHNYLFQLATNNKLNKNKKK